MKRFDVCVLGAGVVGQSLALSLARLGFQVALVSQPAEAARVDVRAYALNAASVGLLKSLKVWDALPPRAATPVYDMHIEGDAASGLLEFSAWQQRFGELAWIVDAPVLEQSMAAAVRYAPHVTLVAEKVEASLTALCEGKASATREALGVTWDRHDYGHTAIAARLSGDVPHANTARQWFRQPDVLALLPFEAPQPGRSHALVWSRPEARAQELMALDGPAFEQMLQGGLAADARAGAQLVRPRLGAAGRCRPRGAPSGRAGPEPRPGRCGRARRRHLTTRSLARAGRCAPAAPLRAAAPGAHDRHGPAHRWPVALVFT
jgi:2-polyprenyl-6-methoxyphenol hydroxylase-like FAD-dependent oxidoreductase